MKKISIIVSTLSNGGAERVASNLTFDFENDFETKLILFENKISYPYLGDCISINIPKSNNFVKKIINIFRRKNKLKRIKKKEKFDCSISLLNGPNYINVKSKTKNEKTIVSIRNITIMFIEYTGKNRTAIRQIIIIILNQFALIQLMCH